ncbi:hypothetical protein Areg01_86110 [Actinoplanes regularis]|nr:hypothetical protein Areg01_86110 [Actinoplanes regularis]
MWIAAGQDWVPVAWILGILGAVIATLLAGWLWAGRNRRPVKVTYTRQPGTRHLPPETWQRSRGEPWMETVGSRTPPTGDSPLTAARIIACVPSTDLVRSRAFYEGLLGLTVARVTPIALELRAGEVTIQLTEVRGGLRVQPFAVLGWAVEDVFATALVLGARGVQFVDVDGEELHTDVVYAVPNGTRVAWFRDPDGNVLSVTAGRRAG